MSNKAAEKPGEPKRTFIIDGPTSCFMWGGVALLILICTWDIIDMVHSCIEYPQWYGPCTLENENIRGTLIFILAPILLTLLVITFAFRTYGKITIYNDRFELHALFRRKRVIYYSDFKHWGIDYWIRHKGLKVYYIYFLSHKPEEKYAHKERVFYSDRKEIYITYSDALYESLLYYLPDNMATMLKSYHSCEVFGFYEKRGWKNRK